MLGSQEWLKRARVGYTAAPMNADLAPSEEVLLCIIIKNCRTREEEALQKKY
jgi:hypothetical protein